MQRAHLVHELALRGAHIEQRLPGLRVDIEDHEIHRVPGAQQNADLRVVLEAADAGAVAAARVDDDVGALLGVDRHALGRDDAHERVVDRPLERATVDHHLVLEAQHRRLTLLHVLEVVVAALAQRVPEDHRALRAVYSVLRPRRPGRGGLQSLRCCLRALAEPLGCGLQPVLQYAGDSFGNVDAAGEFLADIHGVGPCLSCTCRSRDRTCGRVSRRQPFPSAAAPAGTSDL
jgi:hypothetical protein